MWRRIVAFTFGIVGAACGGGEVATDPGPDPGPDTTSVRNTPGTSTISLTVDGQAREFVVHVGLNSPATAAPVVVVLHGTSGSGPDFFDRSRWREKADTIGFIAVFPSALAYCYREDDNGDGDIVDPVDLQVATRWTIGVLNTPAMPLCTPTEVAALPAVAQARVTHPFVEDTPFVDAVLAWLRTNRRIDDRRVYGTGFSAGGAMIHRLLVERNSVFAALHAHAGPMFVTPMPGRAISFVFSLGNTDDRFMAFLRVPAIPLGQQTLTSEPFKGWLSTHQVTQLRLADQFTYSQSVLGGKTLARWTFRNSLSGAGNSYEFVLFEDLGHVYPVGASYPVTMADVIWPFFAAQRLP